MGSPESIRRLTLAAEDLDYATVWVGDHLLLPEYATQLSPANWYEALTCCIHGLALTSRIRFGTDVLVLPYRDPRLLAKMASTADQLSGGRLTLGVGVGFLRGEFEALEVPTYAERGALCDEHLEVLRALWSEEGAVSHRGQYLQFEGAHALPKPQQQPLPLWVGGNGPRAWRRAARLGDGWHPLFPDEESYRRGREAILAHRGARGVEGFTFSYSCSETRITDGLEGERQDAHSYASMGELPPDYDYAPPVPRNQDGRAYFVGSESEIRGDIETLAAAGVQHFALRFWSGDPTMEVDAVLEQMRRFARSVRPHFEAS